MRDQSWPRQISEASLSAAIDLPDFCSAATLQERAEKIGINQRKCPLLRAEKRTQAEKTMPAGSVLG